MGFFSNDIKIDNYYEDGKYSLALKLCFLFSGLFFLLTIFESFNSIRNTIIYGICTVVPIAELIYLRKTKKYRVVYFTLCSIGTILAAYTLNFFIEEVHYGDLLWMILIILLAYWGLNIKFGFFFLIINIVIIAYYFYTNAETNFTSIRELTFIVRLSIFIEVAVAFISITAVIHQFIKFYKYSYETLLENNKLISTKNDENVILMKEVHHRVKNNLQIITSLLRLQKNTLTPEANQQFEEAISRIMTMSLIHQKLYQANDLSKINVDSYINDLIREISSSYSSNDNIQTIIKTNYNSLGLKTIVPFGLLLNELLSNSYKHAFGHLNSGEININISSINNCDIELVYSDSGKWTLTDNQTNFGMELIATLTEQMEGTFTRTDSKYVFKLKNLDI